MESKRDIRKRILTLRSLLNESQWKEYSRQIYERLTGIKELQEAAVLYLYMDFRKEAGMRELIEYGWSHGKSVAVPKIENDEMKFYRITSFDDVKEGYFHVREPITREEENGHGVMVMPGVAFDLKRNRLGYGKGFYDRFLEKHEGIFTIAAAFELQVVGQIPADPHDIRPEYLVTEKRMI